MHPNRTSSVSANGRPRKPDELLSSYEELNALWKQAEEHLAAMRVSVPVEVEVKAEHGEFVDAGSGPEPTCHLTTYLGWRRLQKDWRLCRGVLRDDFTDHDPVWHWKPLAECPMEDRIELAEHLPELKNRMKKARLELIPKVKAAIAVLTQALDD